MRQHRSGAGHLAQVAEGAHRGGIDWRYDGGAGGRRDAAIGLLLLAALGQGLPEFIDLPLLIGQHLFELFDLRGLRRWGRSRRVVGRRKRHNGAQ